MASLMPNLLALSAILALGCSQAPLTGAPGHALSPEAGPLAALRGGQVLPRTAVARLGRLEDAAALARDHGLVVTRTLAALRTVELTAPEQGGRARDTEALLTVLWADRRVETAEPCVVADLRRATAEAPSATVGTDANDPLRGQQYGLDAMAVPEAWQTTRGRAEVVVALIDTGVDGAHPDLASNLAPEGFDAYHGRRGPTAAAPELPGAPGAAADALARGTHLAGVIAAEAGNGRGIAGVAPGCKLLAIKALPTLADHVAPRKSGATIDAPPVVATAIAEGLIHAAERGAAVIAVGLTLPTRSAVVADAVAFARRSGATVIAGVENDRAAGGPANAIATLPGVIAVGATDGQERPLSDTGLGGRMAVSAPGYHVLSTAPGFLGAPATAAFRQMDGTSVAAAQAAGVAALVKSVAPGLSPDQIADVLARSADDQGPKGWDAAYGYGRLNAARALKLAAAR